MKIRNDDQGSKPDRNKTATKRNNVLLVSAPYSERIQ